VPKTAKKSPNSFILKIQGRSVSSILVPTENSLRQQQLPVMISSKSGPDCNRFHAKGVGIGKNNDFLVLTSGYLSLTLSCEGNLFTQLHEILTQNTDTMKTSRSYLAPF